MTWVSVSACRNTSTACPSLRTFIIGSLLSLFAGSLTNAAPPTAQSALQLVPTQRGVPYDRPTADDANRCRVETIQASSSAGWIVQDPNGKVLRRFVDSNKDNIVDQWCYFQDGVETYRDIDSDFDRKADQYRWLNTGGSRWGMDTDEDGSIDHWKSISAQEVSYEIVNAIVTRDADRFERLLLNSRELEQLGLGDEKAKALQTKLSNAKGAFHSLVTSKSTISDETKWVHFSASQPGLVPAGTEGMQRDLTVYENVVAMVETAGKADVVQIGTLVRVGDVWRVIDAPSIPSPGGTSTVGNFFFQNQQVADNSAAAEQSDVVSDEMQNLLSELETFQRTPPPSEPEARAAYYEKMANLLERLVVIAPDRQQQTSWLKQLADNVGAAVQTGDFPQGVERLEGLEKKLIQAKAAETVISYVAYRRLLAAYSRDMQGKKADFPKIQKRWLGELETFVEQYPKAEDAPESLMQLAMAQEFAGEEDEAKTWYAKIVADFPGTSQAKKAVGAKRRLDSVGQVLSLKGTSLKGETIDVGSLKGSVVLIQFWATWCEPCKRDMEELSDLIAKYGRSGFTVVGVNVDQDRSAAIAFAGQYRMAWPNIHEAGGLDSRPAIELGVLTLPTMILLDTSGKVVDRNIHITELEDELKEHIKTARKPARRAGAPPR